MSSDATWHDQIRDSRDPQLLADYIEQRRASLRSFMQRITGPRLLAVVELDDLLQEIAATAITSLATAPLDDYSVWQWLQQIARRRAVDAHRFHFEAKCRDASRQKSLQDRASTGGGNATHQGLEALLAASITSPSDVLSRDIRLSALRQAIDALPEEQRQAITLRYVEGQATKAIAAVMGKSDAAVRVMLSRSTKLLEQRLQDVRPN
ncbi:MAG: sigma-70 family RNA polymerase sigma factor [Planctomycetota bacterium]